MNQTQAYPQPVPVYLEEPLWSQLTQRSRDEQIPPAEFIRRAVLVALTQPAPTSIPVIATTALPFTSGERITNDAAPEEGDREGDAIFKGGGDAVRGYLNKFALSQAETLRLEQQHQKAYQRQPQSWEEAREWEAVQYWGEDKEYDFSAPEWQVGGRQ